VFVANEPKFVKRAKTPSNEGCGNGSDDAPNKSISITPSFLTD
jgi:hypothetical protein